MLVLVAVRVVHRRLGVLVSGVSRRLGRVPARGIGVAIGVGVVVASASGIIGCGGVAAQIRVARCHTVVGGCVLRDLAGDRLGYLALLFDQLLALLLLSAVDIVVECVAILLYREFLVVVHGNLDHVAEDGLLFRTAEVFHVGVLQGLLHAEALLRVEDQQLLNEVDALFGAAGKKLVKRLLLAHVDGVQDAPAELRLNGLNVVCLRLAEKLDDSFNLVESRRSWEDRLADHQLTDYAPDRPHINGLRVFRRPQQDLRGSVPVGCDQN